MTTPERGKRDEQQGSRAPATISILPMNLRVGDRFTENEFEWEIVSHPEHLHGGKTLCARVQRPGLPESERQMTWAAHDRVEVRRGVRQ